MLNTGNITSFIHLPTNMGKNKSRNRDKDEKGNMEKTVQEMLKLLQDQQKEIADMRRETKRDSDAFCHFLKSRLNDLAAAIAGLIDLVTEALLSKYKDAMNSSLEKIQVQIEETRGRMARQTESSPTRSIDTVGACRTTNGDDSALSPAQNPERGNANVQNPDRVNGDVRNPSRANGAVQNPSRANGDVQSPYRDNGDVQHPFRANGDALHNPEVSAKLEKLIDEKLQVGRFNEAFQLAVQYNLVVYAYNQLNPAIFDDQPALLQPNVLLSLIRHLSANLHYDTELRANFLVKLVQNLVKTDALQNDLQHQPPHQT